MVKRSVIVLRKVLAAVVVRDVSPILQPGGVGIVERCMKRILIDYELEKARVYSRK